MEYTVTIKQVEAQPIAAGFGWLLDQIGDGVVMRAPR